MIWQNWSNVSIQINTKASQGIVRCSTSHTRKRRFMLVPGPPLLFGGFAFYNWDILMSKISRFFTCIMARTIISLCQSKKTMLTISRMTYAQHQIERSHLSIHNFLHPALWMLLHRQRKCVLAASQLKCNFIVVAYLIFRRLCKNLHSCVPMLKNN